jgi:Fur family ferric uptake transcriptional regulator
MLGAAPAFVVSVSHLARCRRARWFRRPWGPPEGRGRAGGSRDPRQRSLKVNVTLIQGRILPPAAAVNRGERTANRIDSLAEPRDGPVASTTSARCPRRAMMGGNMASSVQPSLPKNYQLIYEIVEEGGAGCHLTPAEIYAKAVERRPGIGFSTVYRGLVRLRDLGLVSELYVPGVDAATFEPSGPRHAHFRCTECGGIEDVPYAIPARTIRALALEHGLQIESERVTFEGRCKACGTS